MPIVVRLGLFRARLVATIAAALLLVSCERRGLVLVALDEAFSVARPGLARELQAPAPRWYRSHTVPLRLSEEPGKILAELEAARSRGDSPVALIASPLLASALPGPWRAPGTEDSCLGDAALLVPEWRVQPPAVSAGASGGAGFALAATALEPAYAAAGSASGAYLASLRASGDAGEGSPACAILFLEAPSRPRAALEAFARAYDLASGGAPLLVRELAASEDDELQAQAAVRELLGADLRLLFVAIGGGGPAAIGAAARPGLVVGGDFLGPEPPPGLAFRVRPDDRGIAKALRNALTEGVARGTGARRDAIPALLEAMPAGKDPYRKAIAPFLRSAERELRRGGQ